jgi:hypothetical protein
VLLAIGVEARSPSTHLSFQLFLLSCLGLCLHSSSPRPLPSTVFSVIFGIEFCFNFSVLDLCSFPDLYMTRSSPPASSASPSSTASLRSLHRLSQGRAWCTRSRGFSALFGAWLPCSASPLSTASSTGVSWLRQRFWPLRGSPFAARVSHAPSGTAPIPPSASAFSVVFVFIFLFFWAYLFYFSHVYPCNRGVWVLVTQYTLQITFTGDPGFVVSVPQAKGPASSEALPPRTFILSFVLGLPSSIMFYFVFFFLM